MTPRLPRLPAAWSRAWRQWRWMAVAGLISVTLLLAVLAVFQPAYSPPQELRVVLAATCPQGRDGPGAAAVSAVSTMLDIAERLLPSSAAAAQVQRGGANRRLYGLPPSSDPNAAPPLDVGCITIVRGPFVPDRRAPAGDIGKCIDKDELQRLGLRGMPSLFLQIELVKEVGGQFFVATPRRFAYFPEHSANVSDGGESLRADSYSVDLRLTLRPLDASAEVLLFQLAIPRMPSRTVTPAAEPCDRATLDSGPWVSLPPPPLPPCRPDQPSSPPCRAAGPPVRIEVELRETALPRSLPARLREAVGLLQ
jgi:hypothetical protein